MQWAKDSGNCDDGAVISLGLGAALSSCLGPRALTKVSHLPPRGFPCLGAVGEEWRQWRRWSRHISRSGGCSFVWQRAPQGCMASQFKHYPTFGTVSFKAEGDKFSGGGLLYDDSHGTSRRIHSLTE